MDSVHIPERQDQSVSVQAQNIPSSKAQAADHHPDNTLNWQAAEEVVHSLDSRVDTLAARHTNLAAARY